MHPITASHRLFFLSLSITFSFLASCVESSSYTPVPPSIPAARLPMNDAYLGSVHAGPLRPLFRWEPSTAQASGTISYELQLSPDSTFETNVTSTSTTETSYQPDADLPVSLTPPVGTRYFWRLRSCLRNSCSDYSRPRYFNLGRVIKDYNGDGYSDLAVGAPGDDSVYPDSGRIFVYFGNTGSTMDGASDLSLGLPSEVQQSGRMGTNVHGVGDINGDGFADLMWAHPSTPVVRVGTAYLYLGGAGSSFDNIADTDFATGIELDGFGFDVGGLGDVNGDGFADLFVTFINDGRSSGRTDIFLGNKGKRNDTKADASLAWTRIAAAGDVNGDGAADVLVGEPENSTGGQSAGAAHLIFGTFGGQLEPEIDASLLGRGYFDLFGEGISSAGDVNHDGFGDIIVGNSRTADNGGGLPGNVDVFLGNSGFLDTNSDATLSGSIGNDAFGTTLSGVGDVNGDGFDDVLIGAKETDLIGVGIDVGMAYLYLGGDGASFDTIADATFAGKSPFSSFAEHVSSAGDTNGDGVNDIEICAPGHANSSGRVDVFLGRVSSGVDATPDTTIFGAAAGDNFGDGVAFSRDVPFPAWADSDHSSIVTSILKMRLSVGMPRSPDPVLSLPLVLSEQAEGC
jgi:FG-GAP-like repeat/FG-GAP repeat